MATPAYGNVRPVASTGPAGPCPLISLAPHIARRILLYIVYIVYFGDFIRNLTKIYEKISDLTAG